MPTGLRLVRKTAQDGVEAGDNAPDEIRGTAKLHPVSTEDVVELEEAEATPEEVCRYYLEKVEAAANTFVSMRNVGARKEANSGAKQPDGSREKRIIATNAALVYYCLEGLPGFDGVKDEAVTALTKLYLLSKEEEGVGDVRKWVKRVMNLL